MEIEDDEILQGFIEESLEHLADIENDLLAIEEGGANIDEDLVNKVFRAAHSIKGGAGFMGLTAIQDLSHAAENVLGMIRSKKLIPTPEIINVLLIAADQLQSLIEDVQNSNEVDISSNVTPLNAIAEGTFSQSAGVQKEVTEVKVAVEIEAEPEETDSDEPVLTLDAEDAPSVEEPAAWESMAPEEVEEDEEPQPILTQQTQPQSPC
jgi:two-component system chemotaxis sensor kinase CheA